MKSLAVFIDLRKAFDSIDPLKLMLKLLKLNIDPRILRYLCAYFIGRCFSINLLGFISYIFRLFKGCPQGSILAPLLFALFYNGVGSALLLALYKLFADDLVFYIFGLDVLSLLKQAQEILASLKSWCDDNDLTINFSKTKYIIFHKPRTSIAENLPDLICNNEVVERVFEFKYLGVIYDSKLSFKSHYNHVCSRVSSAVGCLLLIKRYLTLQMFKIFTNSFVYSIIDYCLPIWGCLSNTQVNSLQSKINSVLGAYFFPQLCNKFQRYNRISHSVNNEKYKKPNLDYSELLQRCNLLSVSERIQYFNATFAYKSLRFAHVPEISDLFVFGNSARSQNLRQVDYASAFLQKSPIYQAIKTWNKLSPELKAQDVSLGRFKTLLGTWLIGERLNDFISD